MFYQIETYLIQNVKTAIYKKLGEEIRKLRKERNLTQEKLAELTKIDPKSIVDIETGKRNPTLKTITKIAQALKAAIVNLLN